MNTPGAPPAPAAATRLVVTLGGGVPNDGRVSPGLDAIGLAHRLSVEAEDRETVRAVQARELGASLAAVEARLADAGSELAARRTALSDTTAGDADRRLAIEAGAAARRVEIDAVVAAAQRVVDAAGEWHLVLDRHAEAESVLGALATRVGTEDEPGSTAEVTEEMTGGESVLARSEQARRRSTLEAVAGLVDVASAIAVDVADAPLRLAGLLVLRQATRDADERRAVAGLEGRLAGLTEERDGIAGALAAVETAPKVDPVASTLDAISSLDGDPVVLDDVLCELPDDVAAAVLEALPARLAGRRLVYVTDDVRVLSWAIALPPGIGGVAGAVTTPSRSE